MTQGIFLRLAVRLSGRVTRLEGLLKAVLDVAATSEKYNVPSWLLDDIKRALDDREPR